MRGAALRAQRTCRAQRAPGFHSPQGPLSPAAQGFRTGAALCALAAAAFSLSAFAQAEAPAQESSASIAAAAISGQALRGKAVYEAQCSACHSADAHRVGPAHRSVVGRRAGTAPGYAYSDALRRSTVVWTPENLKAWLANPEAVIAGQAMGYQLESATSRDDVVAYLATLVARSPGLAPSTALPER